MKKKEIFLIAGILAAALILWGIFQIVVDKNGDLLRITVDQEIYGEYSLDRDQTIRINDTNTCVIKDGVVNMTEADCPDHLCIEMNEIKNGGQTIVCLPNKVLLEIISEDGNDDIDTTAS